MTLRDNTPLHISLSLTVALFMTFGCGDDGPPGSSGETGTAIGDGDGDGSGDGDGDGDGSGDGDGDGSGDGDGDGSGDGDGDGDGDPLPPIDVEDFEQICLERDHENCYYVSISGNFPPGTENQQLEMAEVSTHPFVPNDIILFARGDVWRQETNGNLITLTSSGTADDYIVFSAYGDGPDPSFFGSTQATAWMNTSGDVWESSTDIPNNPRNIDSGAQLFFVEDNDSAIFGHYEDSTAGLDNPGDWTWSAGRVSVFATDDPADLYKSVEAPQARRLVALNNQEYVAFDSLILRFMVNAGFYDSYGNAAGLRGLRVTNSEIANIGVKGSTSAYGLSLERSDVQIAGCEIHDCGRRSISLVLYETNPSVIRDVVIEGNHFYNGFHTTGVDIQANTPNNGGHLIENIVIRGNLFEGDPDYEIDGDASNHIFINQDEVSTLRDIYIHNNLFTFIHGSGIKTLGGQGYHIHNNTFYGFNPSYDDFQAHITGGTKASNTTIVNNLFYNDAPDNRYACIQFADGRHDEYTIDRNLYFTANFAHARLLWVANGTSYFFDDDWMSYTEATGFDANSPTPDDPEFVGAPADLQPLASSPAVGIGVDVPWIEVDYQGVPVSSPPDLGAIQH